MLLLAGHGILYTAQTTESNSRRPCHGLPPNIHGANGEISADMYYLYWSIVHPSDHICYIINIIH